MRSNRYYADILVIGGGISGVVSAIIAARQGASVILVEKSSCLGGCATSGLLGEINAVSLQGRNILPHIGQEILERMIEKKAGYLEEALPMTSNPDICVDRFRYNGEYLKLVLDSMAVKAGVKVYLNCEARVLSESEDSVEVEVKNPYETIQLTGKVLIDSTGNSQCVYQLGGETSTTDKDKIQAVSIVFRMGGVDLEKFMAYSKDDVQKLLDKGEKSGVLPARIFSLLRIPGTNEIAVNCTRLPNVNHESMEEVSESYIQLRKQIEKILPFIIENVPGCENAYLSNIAPMLGVRDRRKTIGLYELTGEDLIQCKDFEDAVAVGAYPVDIHVQTENGAAVRFVKIQGKGIYKIPYRCLVPKGLSKVLINGKGICADDTAYGAFRVMSSMISIASAVGIAAVMMVQDHCSASEVDVKKLQETLRSCGMIEI